MSYLSEENISGTAHEPCGRLVVHRAVQPAISIIVAATALIVLLGWVIKSSALMSVSSGMTSMKANTAIGLLALSIALVTLGRSSKLSRGTFLLCVVFVTSISLITQAEYLFGFTSRIDTLFFADVLTPRFPGRMAPATACCFLFLAVAYVAIEFHIATEGAQTLLLIIAAAPLTTLGGYLYRTPGMYRDVYYPVIALHTAIALMLLCVGGLVATESCGLMRLIVSDSLAGKLFRLLLPAAVGVPLMTGFIVLLGQREGLYTVEFASALVVGCCVLFFAVAVWRSASLLFDAEQDLQRSKQAAELARETAEQANRSKDVFMAAVSHELRTPLNPILIIASLMRTRTDLPKDAIEDAETIYRSVKHESTIIDDLLNLTRIQRGKIVLHQEVLDLHKLAHEIVDDTQPLLNDRGITVKWQLQAPLSDIWADPGRIRQALANVIGNAIKFSPNNSIILVSSSAALRKVQLTVTDQGVGIPADLQTKLFTPFEQGEKTTTRQFGGLGLGLVITKSILQLHGGSIAVSSDGPGTGATFTLELELTESLANAAAHTTAPLCRSAKARDPEPRRILLVEDHPDTRRIMTRLLKGCGHEVVTATNLCEALAAAQSWHFDLLMSDLGLPDGSGLDLPKAMRHLGPIKAIALSGYGLAEDVRRSKEAGFDEHLIKPVDFDRLRAAIQQLAMAA